MDVLDAIDQTTDTDLDLGVQQPDDQHVDPAPKEQQAAPEEKSDGRKFNPEWSKALKRYNEQYPEDKDMFTKLRDNYARYQTLQELAPKGIDDVRAWKSTIDAVGGPEKAAEMMQRVATMEQVDAKIEAGDFSVVSELPEGMQKGFYQMIPDALTNLQEKDPQAYSAAVMPHFASALAGTGMADHLKTMYAKAEGNPEVQALIKQQYDWLQNQLQGAGKLPSGQRSVNPEVQRLQKELETRTRADDDAFVAGITTSTQKYVDEAFAKNAEVYLKQFNLTDAQKSDLLESFGEKLTAKLGADAAFNKQLAAYKSLKNRSPDTVNAYIRSKVDENAKPIIDGLVTARYGGMRRKAAPSPTTQSSLSSGGMVVVAQRPPQSEWDMSKMDAAGYENSAKIGVYHLRNGRSVKYSPQA